jgi:glycerol kinase
VAGGLIQWLRDGLRLIDHAGQCDVLGRRVSNSGGAVVVPAFVGLGAPHWDPHARGAIFGLTAGVTSEHICRSALEAIAHQVADVLDLMGPDVTPLRVDGGAARSDLLLELQATITGRTVIRPSNIETTGLGAAYLAGIAAGVWSSPDEIRNQKAPDRTVVPKDGLEPVSRETWRDAVERSRYWASDGQAPT